jgi:hypothetical protein
MSQSESHLASQFIRYHDAAREACFWLYRAQALGQNFAIKSQDVENARGLGDGPGAEWALHGISMRSGRRSSTLLSIRRDGTPRWKRLQKVQIRLAQIWFPSGVGC